MIKKEKKVLKHLKILYVGNLNPEKGLEYLFAAIASINHDVGSETVQLTVAGNGPLLKQYQEEYPSTHFRGTVPRTEIPAMINGHDLVVLPTLVESFPNALLEAMACGKPVIASKVYGIPEMVTNGYNGFLVPPKDAAVLADAITNFQKYPALLITMGKNARKTVEDRFNKEKQMAELFQMIEDALPKNGSQE